MIKNLLKIPTGVNLSSEEEFFEDLLTAKEVRLERIISEGHVSPKDFWYDQEVDEWVMILKGSAEIITLDKGKETLWKLQEGDSILLKAHQKHRVEKTSTTSKTIWLALHGNIDNGIVK